MNVLYVKPKGSNKKRGFFFLGGGGFIVKIPKCVCVLVSAQEQLRVLLVLEANNTQSYFSLFMNVVHLHNTHFSASFFLPNTAAGAPVANTTATSLLYTFLVNVSLVFSLKFFMCKCILFSGLL
jgi:hypothetical protein